MKVNFDITKSDGNAFVIMGGWREAAKKAKMPEEEIDAIIKDCMSGDYQHLIATISEHSTTQEKYWTYYFDGEFYDAEFESRKEAYDSADKRFAEQCVENGITGEDSLDITIIEFEYDEEGIRVELSKEETQVEYEDQQGDYAEHNTMHLM